MCKKRIDWIDTVKGLSILLVILGHTPRDIMKDQYVSIFFLKKFIYSFHMSIFFFLSGYIFAYKQELHISFIKKKFYSLFLPWLNFSIFMYLIRLLAEIIPGIGSHLSNSSYALMNIRDYILNSLNGINPYAIHTWYLLTLFVIQILVFFIILLSEKWKVKENWICIFLVFISVLLFFCKSCTNIGFFIRIDDNLFYYVLGFIFYKKGWKQECPVEKGLITLCIGTIFSIGYILAEDMNLVTEFLAYSAIMTGQFLIGRPLMIYAIINLSLVLARKNAYFISWLGENSFVFFLLHQPVACAFVGMALSSIIPLNLVTSYFIMIICVITSLAFPYLLVTVACKMKIDVVLKILFNIRFIPFPLDDMKKRRPDSNAIGGIDSSRKY